MVTYRASPSHSRGGKRIDPRPRGLPNTSRWNGGYKTSFSGRDTNSSLYRRPTILQLNIEGFTATKIGVIEQLASKHQALVVLLQETHCHNAQNLESLRKKLSTRVSLIRRLAETSWGAGTSVLRIATLALVYLTAEYCELFWCRSAHTRLIDPVINTALRVVTGCRLPTPTDYITVLSGIPPAELRRRQAILILARRAWEPNHILHHKIISPELK